MTDRENATQLSYTDPDPDLFGQQYPSDWPVLIDNERGRGRQNQKRQRQDEIRRAHRP